jgi:hypothetical protein
MQLDVKRKQLPLLLLIKTSLISPQTLVYSASIRPEFEYGKEIRASLHYPCMLNASKMYETCSIKAGVLDTLASKQSAGIFCEASLCQAK